MTGRTVPVVRAAKAADAEAIGDLLYQFDGSTGHRDIEKILSSFDRYPNSHIRIADYDGVVAGVIDVHIAPQINGHSTWAKVSTLVVHERYRRHQIGRALLQAAESIARRAGSATIELTSGMREERTAAHRFYPSLGYEDTGKKSVRYKKTFESAHTDE